MTDHHYHDRIILMMFGGYINSIKVFTHKKRHFNSFAFLTHKVKQYHITYLLMSYL